MPCCFFKHHKTHAYNTPNVHLFCRSDHVTSARHVECTEASLPVLVKSVTAIATPTTVDSVFTVHLAKHQLHALSNLCKLLSLPQNTFFMLFRSQWTTLLLSEKRLLGTEACQALSGSCPLNASSDSTMSKWYVCLPMHSSTGLTKCKCCCLRLKPSGLVLLLDLCYTTQQLANMSISVYQPGVEQGVGLLA